MAKRDFTMKKRWSLVLALSFFVLILGGCGAQIPDMTEEERKAISEYAAGLLLKYDTSHPSRLVDLEKVEEAEPTAEPEVMQTPTPDVQTTPVPESSAPSEEQPDEEDVAIETPVPESWDPLERTLLLPEGVTLQLVSHETVDSYQETTVGKQELKAEQGKKLLIFRFEMINDNDTKQEIDMLQDNILYKIYVQDEVANGLLTMLEQDLTTYIGSIEAKSSMELLLFAEVKEELLQNTSEIYVEFVCKEMITRIKAE